MSCKIILILFLGLVLATLAVPMSMFGGQEEEEEPQQPAYEINPHFGFRRYFEMRYEPLSVPFPQQPVYSAPPSPPNPYY